MSGTVRILAIMLGTATAAILHFYFYYNWYVAGVGGAAILIGFPILHEFVADLRRRNTRSRNDRRREQERKDSSGQ